MTSFRFAHTADIHLDSPLRGLAGQEGSAAERIRAAPREAFDSLIGQAIQEKVDFVVIAGDLYDGNWRDYRTGLFFVRQMGRLAAEGIPSFCSTAITMQRARSPAVSSCPGMCGRSRHDNPRPFALEELGVTLHGQSFPQRDVTDNLVPGYPQPKPGTFNIGVLHTALGGMGDHANYAPCTLDDLVNKGYDYWALGHVHQGCVLNERPHVVFPGNLQGRHIRATGPKSAYLVTVDDGEVAELSPMHADVVRWALLPVPVDGCTRMNEVVDRVRTAIENAV